MSLLRALRNVVANLAEGVDPTSVRQEANADSSSAFKSRLAAAERTESFLLEVRPQVDAALHEALDRSVAHTETPITSLPGLLELVRTARTGQSVAVGRAGWPETHPETHYANDLAALALALERLLDVQGLRRASPGTSSGSSQSAA